MKEATTIKPRETIDVKYFFTPAVGGMADDEQHINVEVILHREGSLYGYQKTCWSGETLGYRVTNVLYRITILFVVVILSQIQYNNITKVAKHICCNMFPDSVKRLGLQQL